MSAMLPPPITCVICRAACCPRHLSDHLSPAPCVAPPVAPPVAHTVCRTMCHMMCHAVCHAMCTPCVACAVSLCVLPAPQECMCTGMQEGVSVGRWGLCTKLDEWRKRSATATYHGCLCWRIITYKLACHTVHLMCHCCMSWHGA